MIANLADAMVVINEQKATIKKLREEARLNSASLLGSTGEPEADGKGQQDGVRGSLNQLIVYHAEQEGDRASVKDYEKAAEHRNKRHALENFKDLYFNVG